MTQEVSDNLPQTDVMQMTTEVVAAYVGSNNVGGTQVPGIIKSVYASLAGLDGQLGAETKQQPAVPIKKSITADYLICLEDGKKIKMLKRYLRTSYGLSPDEYRAKWGLGPDYPMVAPNYSKQRSAIAKKFELGKHRS